MKKSLLNKLGITGAVFAGALSAMSPGCYKNDSDKNESSYSEYGTNISKELKEKLNYRIKGLYENHGGKNYDPSKLSVDSTWTSKDGKTSYFEVSYRGEQPLDSTWIFKRWYVKEGEDAEPLISIYQDGFEIE